MEDKGWKQRNLLSWQNLEMMSKQTFHKNIGKRKKNTTTVHTLILSESCMLDFWPIYDLIKSFFHCLRYQIYNYLKTAREGQYVVASI